MSDFDRLMSDSLKGIRNDHLKQIEAEVPVARRRIQEKLHGRRFRFVVGGLAVAAAALAVIVFVTQTLPRIDRSAPIRPAGEPVVLARIDVPGVDAMEPGLDRLWVAHEEGLSGIDPATGAIATESPTKGVEAMAFNSEAMFAINSGDRGISRIPFGTNEAASAVQIEGTPDLVASSEETVWIAASVGPIGDSQITAYTPHLEVPGDTAVQLEERVVADMTHAEDALWMTASARGSVSGFEVHRFYDEGGQSMWELSTDEGVPADITVGEGAAWVLRADVAMRQAKREAGNVLTRIDLETDETVERALRFESRIDSFAVGEGYLWVITAPTDVGAPADARASLHRIDPATLEEVGAPLEVSGPGSKLAVGYGFVWVGDPNNNQIIQIDPYGEATPEPEESAPEPEETASPADDECATFLPFSSSDGALSLGLGSGGQQETLLEDQSPSALVHFLAPHGGFIDLTTGDPIWPPFDEEPIRVLGTSGTLHAIEDGHAVTFGIGGCTFQLIAYGFDKAEVREFVGSLGLRGHLDSPVDAFAMWPETRPEEAYTNCIDPPNDGGSYRDDPQETALAFTDAVLGWETARVVTPARTYNLGHDYRAVGVARSDGEAARLVVMLREVAAGCWSVTSVQADAVENGSEGGLAVSSIRGRTSISFDLRREAAGHDVRWVRLKVGRGQVLLSREEYERKGIELTDAPLDEPKSWLILLLDESRDVVGAIGQALPSGNFAAG